MGPIHLILTGLACAGLVLAVVLEIRRGREEDRLWKRLVSQQALELDSF
jgi:hypothetical protein